MLSLYNITHLSGLYDFLFLGFLRFLFCITKHHCYWNEFRYPSAYGREHRIVIWRENRKTGKSTQNVRPRKEAERLAGVYQICEATTDGICQRFGSFKASTISGINPPPTFDCYIHQHACGS